MKSITVDESYQSGYTYVLSELEGEQFDIEFRPDLTPEEMLKLGIFGGDYFTTIPNEFPSLWFEGIQLSQTGKARPELNLFKVNASQSLEVWQKKGWIYFEDPKGWFLWYCRYYLGRRIPTEDQRQIKRWRAMRRHTTQIERNCKKGDWTCRPKPRQALLHWAYDSRKM